MLTLFLSLFVTWKHFQNLHNLQGGAKCGNRTAAAAWRTATFRRCMTEHASSMFRIILFGDFWHSGWPIFSENLLWPKTGLPTFHHYEILHLRRHGKRLYSGDDCQSHQFSGSSLLSLKMMLFLIRGVVYRRTVSLCIRAARGRECVYALQMFFFVFCLFFSVFLMFFPSATDSA